MGLIVHAPNVHQGGGRSLLVPLLEACTRFACPLILDERLRIPAAVERHSGAIHRVRPNLLSRLNAERRLRDLAKPDDIVLCMGNLPPLFALSARVFVFVQNRYLADYSVPITDFPAAVRARIGLERLWLKCTRANADTFIVQTETMRDALGATLNVRPLVLPFVATAMTVSRRTRACNSARAYDFVYVASGEPHKNHKNLVEAWVLLAHAGLRPHLCLTVNSDAHPQLGFWIEQRKAAFDLRITNVGELTSECARQLYRDSGALIFPSELESFGLPLIEARHAGLPILAAELDYVRDLVDPEESFDPRSPRSIARAVARFLGATEADSAIVDAATFLNTIIDGGRNACTS